MIKYLKIKNFYSIKDEVTLSFEAKGETLAEESQVVKVNKNTRLLRFAIIYGYNASGKTNVLKAFNFLGDFWRKVPKNDDSNTKAVPFKLDRDSQKSPSSFELVFFVNGIKYRYDLQLDEKTVRLERLSYYKTVKPVELFSRHFENGVSEISYNATEIKLSKTAKENIALKCLRNMSFFAAIRNLNINLPLINEAKNWLLTHFAMGIDPHTEILSAAKKDIAEDSVVTEYLLDFLKKADFNITDLKINSVKKDVPDGFVKAIMNDKELTESEKTTLINNFSNETKLLFTHTVESDKRKDSFVMQEEEESLGTLRTLEIETALYHAIKNNYVMAIDEIETSLHSMLLETILFNYLSRKSESQIIVATHNDGLLDLVDDLIRKDSVWFVEKQKNGSSDLYNLTDFRGINRLSSIRAAYRQKRLGATQHSV